MPIPDHVDIFHLKREMPPSDKTALECVMEVDQQRIRLEKEAELLALKTDEEGKPSASEKNLVNRKSAVSNKLFVS